MVEPDGIILAFAPLRKGRVERMTDCFHPVTQGFEKAAQKCLAPRNRNHRNGDFKGQERFHQFGFIAAGAVEAMATLIKEEAT